ncbi:MAG: sulfotransferase, partial [Proteobacteria bacterium]|nr:sulfotransferase [Pseudomonadota bacterium]
WRNPGKQWMLKAPAHMWAVDAILDVFPDARFIWCHREPVAVTASINSMNRAVMGMYAGNHDHMDKSAIGNAVMEWYAMSLEKGLSEREQRDPSLFIDTSQSEFVSQPMAVVEKVYSGFGMELTDAARAAMHAHIDNNPKGKHGKHEYDVAEYGLTREIIEERFAFYTGDDRWPISD